VVGFDDQDFCSWTNPGLTTVRQPLGEMGVTAARMLLDLVAGRRLSEMRVELPASLVVRASTGPGKQFRKPLTSRKQNSYVSDAGRLLATGHG